MTDVAPQVDCGRWPAKACIGDRVEVLPDRILIYTDDGERVLEHIAHAGHEPLTSLVCRSSLEDVFLRLTGRSLIE